MTKEKMISFRINKDKYASFKVKATEEYGGMSAFLEQKIDAFLTERPIANDAELTALLYAVKALNSYTNNINQIAKKLNSGEHELIDNKMVLGVHDYIVDVVSNFKKCLATRQDAM